MKHQAVRYDFTMRELDYFLFGKKRCPKCGGKLEKNKVFETKRGTEFNSKRGTFLAQNIKVKHYLYIFICQQCNSQFALQELAK